MEEGEKSKRDLLGERLKNKYPDREFGDDEALFSQINDDYDEYDNALNDYREKEGKLADLFTRQPRSAQFITDMAKGRSPLSTLIDHIGIDGIKEMLEDPSKIDEYSEQNRQYIERVAKQKDLEAEWERNMQQTLEMLEGMKQERGLTDEQIDTAADWIRDVTDDAVRGIIKPETIEMALKAINHDTDMASASAEGEIRGRNTRAEAQLRSPERKDAPPMLGGSNNAASAPMRGKSIFNLADEA